MTAIYILVGVFLVVVGAAYRSAGRYDDSVSGPERPR